MKRLAIFLFLCALMAFPLPARADIAPPINPPGANLQPGAESTQVQMQSETVLIAVRDDRVPESLGSAHVTADFNMVNPSAQAEQLAVRFPIAASDGRFAYPEISNIQVRVGGKTVATRRASYPDPKYGNDELAWAEFSVTFPAGEAVAIQVSYDLQGSGYYPYTAFYYLLQTGAGWSGPIGSAEIILRLPYAANLQNVVTGFQIGWAEASRGGEFAGKEVRWLFEDFEPGPDGPVSDMEFALVAPAAWQALLQAQLAVQNNPADGEAWGRLAKRYKDLFFQTKGYREDAGGMELYRLAVEAYEKCLALKPDDAQWHAGFADLLANRSYWDSWSGDPSPETFRALEEIHTALQLAPKDAKVLEIAESISWLLQDGMLASDGGYTFPWLTQTPTLRPPTATMVPSFDPQALAGTYTSGQITLRSGKQTQLTLVLSADHRATLETLLQDAPATTASGTWRDYGDGTFLLALTEASGEVTTFVYRVQPDRLIAVQYSSIYSGVEPDLQRLTTPTASPPPSATPAPSATAPRATETQPAATQPPPSHTPQAGSSADSTPTAAPTGTGGPCGAILLTLLPLAVWLLRRRM